MNSHIINNINFNKFFFNNPSIGEDIWSYIYSYCEIKLIKNLSETCKYFAEIFKSNKFINFLSLYDKQIFFHKVCLYCNNINTIKYFFSLKNFDISFNNNSCFSDVCEAYYDDYDYENISENINKIYRYYEEIIILFLKNNLINPCCKNNTQIYNLSFTNNNELIKLLLNHNNMTKEGRLVHTFVKSIKNNDKKNFKELFSKIKNQNIININEFDDSIMQKCIIHGRCKVLFSYIELHPKIKINMRIYFERLDSFTFLLERDKENNTNISTKLMKFLSSKYDATILINFE